MLNLNLIKDIILKKIFGTPQIENKSSEIMIKNISDDKNFNRVLVIGDIHGHYKKFLSLYKKLNFSDEDLLIFLGDYIDRGPIGEDGYMLDWIVKAVEKDNVIALRGNHEQMMIDFFVKSDLNWIFNGGDKTAKDIRDKKKFDSDIDKKILNFAESLPYSHRMTINDQDYFFCHAGIYPGVAIEDQDSFALLWIRDEFFTKYDGETIIVVGHTPLQLLNPEGSLEIWCRDNQRVFGKKNIKPQWRRNGKILMMDTGSYFINGCISCIDLKSGKLWQSD